MVVHLPPLHLPRHRPQSRLKVTCVRLPDARPTNVDEAAEEIATLQAQHEQLVRDLATPPSYLINPASYATWSARAVIVRDAIAARLEHLKNWAGIESATPNLTLVEP